MRSWCCACDFSPTGRTSNKSTENVSSRPLVISWHRHCCRRRPSRWNQSCLLVPTCRAISFASSVSMVKWRVTLRLIFFFKDFMEASFSCINHWSSPPFRWTTRQIAFWASWRYHCGLSSPSFRWTTRQIAFWGSWRYHSTGESTSFLHHQWRAGDKKYINIHMTQTRHSLLFKSFLQTHENDVIVEWIILRLFCWNNQTHVHFHPSSHRGIVIAWWDGAYLNRVTGGNFLQGIAATVLHPNSWHRYGAFSTWKDTLEKNWTNPIPFCHHSTSYD